MLGTQAFQVSEWDWFKLQLRLTRLELNGKLFRTVYNFDDEIGDSSKQFPEAQIRCLFWCKTTDDLIRKRAPRSEHLEYYKGWVESEETNIVEFAAAFPHLRNELNPTKHILYTILHKYGMGSIPVCEFYGGKVIWRMTEESVPNDSA